MTAAPELRRMVTREMIEAHYKSVMNAALVLLSQDCVALAQNVLSEACSRPYPSPAPASMPEAQLTPERVRQAMEESGWPASMLSPFIAGMLDEFARAIEHAHGIDGTARGGTP